MTWEAMGPRRRSRAETLRSRRKQRPSGLCFLNVKVKKKGSCSRLFVFGPQKQKTYNQERQQFKPRPVTGKHGFWICGVGVHPGSRTFLQTVCLPIVFRRGEALWLMNVKPFGIETESRIPRPGGRRCATRGMRGAQGGADLRWEATVQGPGRPGGGGGRKRPTDITHRWYSIRGNRSIH